MRRGSSSRKWAPVAALVAGVAFRALASAPSQDVSAARPGPDPELLCDDVAVRRGATLPPRSGDVLLEDEFGTLDPSLWREYSADGRESRDPSHATLVADAWQQRGVVVLLPGTGGIHLRIQTARSDAILVTARMRSFSVGQDATLRASERSPAGHEVALGAAGVAASERFEEVAVALPRERGGHQIVVSLIPGDRPLAVDRVEVRCVRPVEGIWLAAPDADAPPLPRARRTVELTAMNAQMEGFFVPTGGALRWRTTIPAAAPRLDLETSLFGGDEGGSAEWTVAVDGAPVALRRESLAAGELDSPFRAWLVPLQEFAGRSVVLELRCKGDRTVLGFAGAPRVLGREPQGAPPSVVLISLDTLRRDRVGPRGERPSLTPAIDALAAHGALFTRACSTSCWTLPAHASLMTGQHPLSHGVFDTDRTLDAARSPLLAEEFRAAGYATAAFTGGGFVDPAFGFDQGFDSYSVRDPDGLPSGSRALGPDGAPLPDEEIDATPARALDWIDRHAATPSFLFLHTFHVHEYDDEAHRHEPSDRLDLLDRATAGDADAVRKLEPRYDACVAETDRDLVGAVLGHVDLAHTIVCILSDHGEEFREHGGFRHGLTLHDEVGSIVLVIAGPGVPEGRRIDLPVSLMDVAPTLARLCRLRADPRYEGVDLFAPDDGARAERPILLRMDHYCLNHVHARGEALWLGEFELQRLWDEQGTPTLTLDRRDPQSGRVTPAEVDPARLAALERRLDAELAAGLSRAAAAPDRTRHELPDALKERLHALGYVGH